MIFSSQSSASNLILQVGMPHIPEKLNHLEINSLYEYVIFDDLLRPLVKFDSNGEITADLAQKWEIKNNFKKFTFTIKLNQYFSNGELITADDVVASLKHLTKNPNIIHGDGNKIKSITSIDKTKFEIEIFESDPFFLTELSSPEYRIIKQENSNYSTTSGHYSVQKIENKNEILLKLNEKFTFPRNVKYNEILLKEYDINTPISDELLKKLDIIWPKSTIKPDEIERIKKNGFNTYEMNLGFSFWFSLNPNKLKKEERLYLKKKLDSFFQKNEFFKDNILKRSFQLFLPYGPGRLTETEIKDIESKQGLDVKINRELKILLPKSVQNEILKSLEKLDCKIKIEFYENFAEYSKLIKIKDYDILLVNNDLSSIDLRSSLIVTFNPSRPLVFTDKKNSSYNRLLKKIQNEQNTAARYQGIKELGQKVLEDTLIYPLFYKMGFIFTKNNIDLSDLSKAGAETFSWKIK